MKNLDNTKISKFRIISGILTGVGSLIVILSLGYLIFDLNKTEKRTLELERQNQNLKVIIAKEKNIDSTVVISFIKEFVTASNNKDLKKYVSFFSDTIQSFFLLDNVNKKDVWGQTKWFWEKNPDVEYVFDLKSLVYSPIGEDSIKILINGYHQKESIKIAEIYSDIRLNKDRKIYYIKDYYKEK